MVKLNNWKKVGANRWRNSNNDVVHLTYFNKKTNNKLNIYITKLRNNTWSVKVYKNVGNIVNTYIARNRPQAFKYVRAYIRAH